MSLNLQELLPIRDGIVMGHVAPDADSVCSSVALALHLRSHGKQAFVFLPEKYPAYLQWILDENPDLFVQNPKAKKIRKFDFLYILDCEPTKQRTGFPIDAAQHRWFNIDHHQTRFNSGELEAKSCVTEFFDIQVPDTLMDAYGSKQFGRDKNGNEFYFEMSGSICGILCDRLGLTTDYLALGMYHDTCSFSIYGVDCAKTLSRLNVSNKRFGDMISNCKMPMSKEEWNTLLATKTWFTEDSGVCFAFDPSPDIENNGIIMNALRSYCRTLVFFYKNGNASMRSSVKEIDLSVIAEQFGGGGHRYAAGFRVNDTDLHILAAMIRRDSGQPELQPTEKGGLTRFINAFTQSIQ